MSSRKGLSWFKGSWLNDASGGPRDLEAERWRNRMFTAETGMTPQQFDEGARIQFMGERAPEAPPAEAPTPGGMFNPKRFARPEGPDFDMSQMEGAADSNSILNRQPDQGVQFTPEQRTLRSSYKEMRERFNKAQEAPYMRATGAPRASLRDYDLAEIGDQLKQYQNMKTKGLDLSPEESAQYRALLEEFNRRAKINPAPTGQPGGDEGKKTSGWGDWFGRFLTALPGFGGTANAAEMPARQSAPPKNPKPGNSYKDKRGNPIVYNAKTGKWEYPE